MSNQTTHETITERHREEFRAEGYCVLRNALPQSLLGLLDEECERAIQRVDAEMDRLGQKVLGGSRRGRQYIPGNCREHQPRLDDFLFSSEMQEVRDRLLGPGSTLMWEQYSVKLGLRKPGTDVAPYQARDDNPQSLGRFSWHQDSGYIPHDHPPYLSCWVALDDTSEENGALWVLPFSVLGIRTRVTHEPEPDNGDLVGYFGSQRGKLVTVRRGDMICFSSTLFHRSGRNNTHAPRRAYLAQYARGETSS